MHDLAVGVDPNGADAWALQDVLALGVTAGAPPDEFNQLGQDWSQPPWRPDQLVERGYEPFRAMVNAVLRHAGGVRVDHIIGLFRLWWIPKGAPPTEGTYVRYDHEAMIGILALEAHRAECGGGRRGPRHGRAVGAALPAPIADCSAHRSSGSSSTATATAVRCRPQRWREYCLSSVTTHDLPPTAGYLAGEHVRLRDELGLLTRPVDEELADDRAEQSAWVDELRRVGLLVDEPGVDETVLGSVSLSGSHPVAAAGSFVGRRGRRDAHPEPAGHHRRIPELAGPAGRPRRASPAARRRLFRPARGRARRGHASRGQPAGVTLRGLSPVSHLSRLRYVRSAPT